MPSLVELNKHPQAQHIWMSWSGLIGALIHERAEEKPDYPAEAVRLMAAANGLFNQMGTAGPDNGWSWMKAASTVVEPVIVKWLKGKLRGPDAEWLDDMCEEMPAPPEAEMVDRIHLFICVWDWIQQAGHLMIKYEAGPSPVNPDLN